jgi:Kef-type K+ transport system membrane component KefB
LGAGAGFLLSKASIWFGEYGFRIPVILASILIVLGLAELLHLSMLLATLSLGFSTRYFTKASAGRLFNPIHPLEETIYLLFFTMSGTHFDPNLFRDFLPLVLVYFFARMLGKMIGARVGTRMVGAPTRVSRWIGLGLLPQAGVAIGLALTLSQESAFEEIGLMVLNVIIGATLLNEMLGPITAKIALQKAQEIHLKRERHRHEGF